MNIDNKKVKHRSFGIGKIIEANDSYIEIEFPIGNKKFVFPDAFAKYLTLLDDKENKAIKKLLEKRKMEIVVEEEKIKEEREELLKKRKLKRERDRQAQNHKSHHSLQVVFWCESDELDKVFEEGRISTGLIKSGANKGKPNRLVRLNRKSLCLLTTRKPDMQEKDRRIKGLFMVEENFMGSLNKDGYIPSHPEYRIRLSEDESEKMLFWNYYVNNRYPDRMTWNTGRYRYFENIIAAQILKDIIALKEDPKERELVENIFDYICEINLIDREKLPKPNGALIRIK